MKKRTRNFLTCIFLVIAIGCGIYLFQYYYKSTKSEKAILKLANLIQPVDLSLEHNNTSDDFIEDENKKYDNNTEISRKFEKIYQLNNDFLGWITIPDTHINYPVMYTPNDNESGEYYIHRDFDENYSAAGLLFVDKNCDLSYPTDNVIIYGHNMNSGTMFHDLLKYEDETFYNQHKTIQFDSIYGDGQYEVVAVFYAEILDDSDPSFKYYEFVNAKDANDFDEYISNIKNMSIHDTGVDVQYGDKLITLSTCAYHVEDGRFAVIAKKIDVEK